MFDELMQSIFQINGCCFDRDKHYFTIIENHWNQEKQNLYTGIIKKLSSYAPRGSTAESGEGAFLGLRLHGVLLADESDIWEAAYEEANHKYHKISIFFLLPSRDSGALSRIKNSLERMNISENIYIFTQDRWNFENLTESISLAIIQNIFFKGERQSRINIATNEVQRYIDNHLAPAVKQRFIDQEYRRIQWSSFCGRIVYPQKDFLRSYLKSLLQRTVINKEEVFRCFDNLVDISLHPDIGALTRAVSMIPCVDSSCVLEQREDFSEMFGNDWKLVLEWTVHTTLASQTATYMINDDTLKLIYDIYTKHCFYFNQNTKSIDIMPIEEILDEYIDRIDSACNRHRIDDIRDTNGLNQYLNSYIDLYNIKRKYAFWSEIKAMFVRQINAQGLRLLDEVNSMQNNKEKLNTLWKSCQSADDCTGVTDYNFTVFDILDILTPCNGRERRRSLREISNIYQTWAHSNNVHDEGPENMNIGQTNCFDTPINRWVTYSFVVDTTNDSNFAQWPYVIKGQEINGIYIILNNQEG